MNTAGLPSSVANGTGAATSSQPVWEGSAFGYLAPTFFPRAFGAVGDNATDDHTALAACITACPAGGTIDLEGLAYYTSVALTTTKANVRFTGAPGSALRTGTNNLLVVTGSGTIVERLNLTRAAGQGAFGQTSDKWCTVVVNATNFVSRDCHYTDAYLACVYFTHAACNGSRVTGGTMTNSSARQNSCGVYAAAGATGNQDIVIDDVTMMGGGCSDAFDFFDSIRCEVRNCRAYGMARLPTLTVGANWALQSGTTYRTRLATGTNPGVDGPTTDRNDGPTRVVKVGGVQMAEDETTPGAPASNSWGESGGYLYINTAGALLSGGNPNSATITSDITSGYGITFYVTANGFTTPAFNAATNNRVYNCDGYGIYMQTGTATGAQGNRTSDNIVVNCVQQGIQDTSLPWGAIAWNGGYDCLSEGDTIISAGGAGALAAPGFNIANSGSGRAIGVTVDGATSYGVQGQSSNWSFTACRANATGNNAWHFEAPTASQQIVNLIVSACTGSNATGSGLYAHAGGAAAVVKVQVIGGEWFSNSVRGVQFDTTTDSKIIGAHVHNNGSGHEGIALTGTATRTIIDDNNVHNESTGISIGASCTITTLGKQNLNANSTNISNSGGPYISSGSPGTGDALWIGSGVPSFSATAGAQYRRTDIPTTPGPWLYVCTANGNNWSPAAVTVNLDYYVAQHADLTTGIQAAIDYVQGAGGGIIDCTPGKVYATMTTCPRFAPGVACRIRGNGCTFRADATITAWQLFGFAGTSDYQTFQDCVIENCTLDLNNVSQLSGFGAMNGDVATHRSNFLRCGFGDDVTVINGTIGGSAGVSSGLGINSNHANAAATPAGSPQVFHNTAATGYGNVSVDYTVIGGTVSDISTSPDNSTWTTTGKTSGTVTVTAGNYIRITYTVAPTVWTMEHTQTTITDCFVGRRYRCIGCNYAINVQAGCQGTSQTVNVIVERFTVGEGWYSDQGSGSPQLGAPTGCNMQFGALGFCRDVRVKSGFGVNGSDEGIAFLNGINCVCTDVVIQDCDDCNFQVLNFMPALLFQTYAGVNRPVQATFINPVARFVNVVPKQTGAGTIPFQIGTGNGFTGKEQPTFTSRFINPTVEVESAWSLAPTNTGAPYWNHGIGFYADGGFDHIDVENLHVKARNITWSATSSTQAFLILMWLKQSASASVNIRNVTFDLAGSWTDDGSHSLTIIPVFIAGDTLPHAVVEDIEVNYAVVPSGGSKPPALWIASLGSAVSAGATATLAGISGRINNLKLRGVQTSNLGSLVGLNTNAGTTTSGYVWVENIDVIEAAMGANGSVANATVAGVVLPNTIPATTQASAYTFALTDAGTVVESTDASANTFTIPANATVPFAVGTVIEVFQQGAGQVTIAAAGGVTLVSDGSKVATAAQNATVSLRQRTANTWVLAGDLA